jgi:hypothetical protein
LAAVAAVPDELEHVLRLVAEGRLTPDEAAPIIEALTAAEQATEDAVEAAESIDLRGLRHSLRHAGRDARRAARDAARQARRGAREASRAALREAGDVRRGLRRSLIIRVTERGRQVVNLRIPLPFADSALRMVPGLGADQVERIRQAIHDNVAGPILDVEDEEGGGVLITVE